MLSIRSNNTCHAIWRGTSAVSVEPDELVVILREAAESARPGSGEDLSHIRPSFSGPKYAKYLWRISSVLLFALLMKAAEKAKEQREAAKDVGLDPR
jgi:hypothetical protein